MKDVCLGRWGIRWRNESDKKLKFPAGFPCLFSSMGIRKDDAISFNEKRVNIQTKRMPVISHCDLRFLEWSKSDAIYGEFLPKLRHSFSARLSAVRIKGWVLTSECPNFWRLSSVSFCREVWSFAVFELKPGSPGRKMCSAAYKPTDA